MQKNDAILAGKAGQDALPGNAAPIMVTGRILRPSHSRVAQRYVLHAFERRRADAITNYYSKWSDKWQSVSSACPRATRASTYAFWHGLTNRTRAERTHNRAADEDATRRRKSRYAAAYSAVASGPSSFICARILAFFQLDLPALLT